MKQKELAFWIKFVILGTAVCGLIIYAWFFPHITGYLIEQNAILQKNELPWLILIWISAIPCYAVLVFGWLISSNIGRDNSFSVANANYLKWVSYMALIDVAYFFIVNVVMLIIDKSHPFIMAVGLVVCFVGTAFSVCAAALSHLVKKASEIKEENDYTI